MEQLNEVLGYIKTYLKTNKDLSQLLTGKGSFINCFNPKTHRLHGRVDTLGANTFRMTHNSPNITQLSKDKEFRELLCVPENRLLVDVDANALELVMLGHYLGKYDNYFYAKAVDSGKKEDKTDIHSINQKVVGLATRDAAKTFIYMTIYGGGAAKIGNAICDNIDFKYSKKEYDETKKLLELRVVSLNGKKYFPINKNALTPFTNELVLKTIYGIRAIKKFRTGTKGYNELYDECQKMVNSNSFYGLDGRKLNPRSPHSAFNLLLQSAGAIYMKYVLVNISKQLSSLYTHGKEYAFVANIHDAINIEIIPEIKNEVDEILKSTFISTSYDLGLKYPVYGEPHFGANQYETH